MEILDPRDTQSELAAIENLIFRAVTYSPDGDQRSLFLATIALARIQLLAVKLEINRTSPQDIPTGMTAKRP